MGCGGSKPEETPDKPEGPVAESDVQVTDLDGPLSKAEVDSRIIGMSKSATFELNAAFTLRYAALSQRGYYPEDLYKANQDRYIVQPNFAGSSNQMLFGVFDGHGE